MAGPETGPTGEDIGAQEREIAPERTRESEIRANIEFWQKESGRLGIKLEEQEVRTAVEALPEKEGYDWIIVVPKGVRIPDALQAATGHRGRLITDALQAEMGYRGEPGVYYEYVNSDKIEMPRRSDNTYAIAARYSQEPDRDSLGIRKAKSAEKWENTGEKFMTPLELIIAEGRWHKENKAHLNKKNTTLFPGSRTEDGKVPYSRNIRRSVPMDPLHGPGYYLREVILDSCDPGKRHHRMGVRRVITKESK